MHKFIKGITASVVLGSVALVGISTPASATDDSTLFTNSEANPGSFDCYTYSSGSWHKLNDGNTRKIGPKTPFKCDSNYWGYIWGGRLGDKAGGPLKKNKAYKIADLAGDLGVLVARKA